MGQVLANKVIQYCSTIGTGTLELGVIAGNNRTWRSRIATGKRVRYHARRVDNAKWEIGEGILTHATTDTISRLTIIDSSDGGTAIAWESADGPFVVFSPADNDLVDQMLAGNIGASRPTWAVAGTGWLDHTAGIAISWLKKRWTGTVDIVEGKFDIAKSIFQASQRRIWTANGAANKTVTADDDGAIFTLDNSAAARTLFLPLSGTAGVGHGFRVGSLGLTRGGAFGVIVTPGATDGIESGADAASVTIPGGVRFDMVWDAPSDTWRIEYYGPVSTQWTGRRQVVATGPMTNGLPTFLPSSSGTLNLTSQNINTTRLVVSAANGWEPYPGKPIDRIGWSVANLAWSSLTASRAAATPNFLYVTINADGSLTPGSTIQAPVYQWSGTPATTPAGLFTFNISEMKGYLANGTTAPEAFVVFLGEAATDGGAVISTVAYAYNGIYEGPWTAGIPNINTTMSADHNIGIMPRVKDWIFECTTADQGFLVGEQISMVQQTQTSSDIGVYTMQPLGTSRNSMHTRTSDYNAYVISNATTGENSNATQASWKRKPIADRGW